MISRLNSVHDAGLDSGRHQQSLFLRAGQAKQVARSFTFPLGQTRCVDAVMQRRYWISIHPRGAVHKHYPKVCLLCILPAQVLLCSLHLNSTDSAFPCRSARSHPCRSSQSSFPPFHPRSPSSENWLHWSPLEQITFPVIPLACAALLRISAMPAFLSALDFGWPGTQTRAAPFV